MLNACNLKRKEEKWFPIRYNLKKTLLIFYPRSAFEADGVSSRDKADLRRMMCTNSPGLSCLQTVQKPSAKVERVHLAKFALLTFQWISIFLFTESARSWLFYNILITYFCLSMTPALRKSHINSKTQHSGFFGCAARTIKGNLEINHIKIATKTT